MQRGLYRASLHRWQLDPALDRFVIGPFVRVFRWCDRMERAWTDLLTGTVSRESDRVVLPAPSREEV
jgi:NAD(P)H-quinone oxidoreductase subunit 5